MAENKMGDGSAEKGVILSCLMRVRRKLWAVRVAERVTLGLAWASGLAVVETGAWLLHQWNPWVAVMVGLLPLAGAGWLWMRSREARWGVGGEVLKLAAILTALVAAGVIGLICVPAAGGMPTWAIGVGSVAVFVIAAAGSVRPVDAKAAAIFVDQQVGLRERVSTALEMLDRPVNSELEAAFRRPVIASALKACQSVNEAHVDYARADRRVYALAVAVALAAGGVSLLTPLPAMARPVSRQFVPVVQNATKLSDAIRQIEEKKLPKDEVTTEKLKPLNNTLAQLKKGDMSPFQASAMLNEIKTKLDQDRKAEDAAERVAKALEAMKGLEDFAKAGDQAKEAGMKAAGGDQAAPGQRSAAEQKMNTAAEAIGAKVKNGMSDKDKKGLSDQLKEAARQAAGNPDMQGKLNDAANAVEKGDGDRAAQDLKDAGSQMEQQRTAGQLSSDAVRQAMSEIDRMERNGLGSGEQMAQGGNSGQGGQGGGQDGQGMGQGQQPGGGGGQDGQGGQQAGGQGNQGQGDQGQGNQGTGGQQMTGGGDGKQGPDSSGSTNFYAPGGPGDRQRGGPIGKQGTFVKIYDPKEIASQGPDVKVSGQINAAGRASGTAEVLGQADKTGTALKTYESEFNGAKQRAMDDLSTQQYPPQYQDLIKAYYEK